MREGRSLNWIKEGNTEITEATESRRLRLRLRLRDLYLNLPFLNLNL